MIKIYSGPSIWLLAGQMLLAIIIPLLVSFPLPYFVIVMMIFGTSVAISVIAELLVIVIKTFKKAYLN